MSMKIERKKMLVNMGVVIKGYLIFPLIFAAILIIMTIALYFVNETAGLIANAALLLYIFAAAVFIYINANNLERGLIRFAREYGGLEGELISDFPMPYVLTDPDGRIVAYNRQFGRIYDEKAGTDNICQIFHELDQEDLQFEGSSNNISLVYDNRDFRLCIKHLKVTRELIESKVVLMPQHDLTICVIYMFDETEIVNMMKKTVSEQMVIGYINVDNYDDIISRDLDVQKNIRGAMIDKVIGAYFANIDGVVRKLDRDRYFVAFKANFYCGFENLYFVTKNLSVKFQFLYDMLINPHYDPGDSGGGVYRDYNYLNNYHTELTLKYNF